MNDKLREDIFDFIKSHLVKSISAKLHKGYPLKKFQINPFGLISLSSGFYGSLTPESMAKALLYPRIFGTSMTTSFGANVQDMCVKLLGAKPSGIAGMDIEFSNKLTGEWTVAQMKAGPNTLNSKDVAPIVNEISAAYRLMRTNGGGTEVPIFALCVLYGTQDQLSAHYKKIRETMVGQQNSIPIYIGDEFWHVLTGEKNFYNELIQTFIDAFDSENFARAFINCENSLICEIEEAFFTNGRFDVEKYKQM